MKRLTAGALVVLALFAVAVGVMAAGSAEFVPDKISIIRGEAALFQRAPYIGLSFDDREAAETGGTPGKTYTAWAELFGIIPIKEVEVQFTERETVVLCGVPVGIKLNTNGILVAETVDLTTDGERVNPGRECGLVPGDCIMTANGEQLFKASQLIEIVKQSEGKEVTLEVRRQDGTIEDMNLQPVYSEADGCYRGGIWIRSGAAGIGVLTFYDGETGEFGGLGHPMTDENAGTVLGASGGEITSVMLTEVVRGASGAPGELIGFLGSERYGVLTRNTMTGVYGYLAEGVSLGSGEYQVALKQEIEEGSAQLVTSVPGSDGVQSYDISIEKINYDTDNPTRNMIVKVTDEDLLELTGGIVQGMSGSPIIQNGRIVGAVTHVLINDPTSGYGIFLENMLEEAS